MRFLWRMLCSMEVRTKQGLLLSGGGALLAENCLALSCEHTLSKPVQLLGSGRELSALHSWLCYGSSTRCVDLTMHRQIAKFTFSMVKSSV